MILLDAVANSSSHPGWSWTIVATWIGGLAGVAYFLELIGFWRWLSRKLPRQRTRAQPASVARVADAISVGVAIALVFASGIWWKVALAAALGAASVLRLVIGRRRHEPSAQPDKATETEPSASGAATFDVSEASEQTAPSPEPRHRIYLRVTNEGPSTPFYAQVVQVTGSVREPSVPWTIRWRGSGERELMIHRGTTELLDVLEAVPMGHRPHEGAFQPGVMIANTLSGDVEMRIGAQTLDDLYVNELGLAIVIVNVQTGERQNVFLRVGLEKEHELAPRLNLFHEHPQDDASATAPTDSVGAAGTSTRRGSESSRTERARAGAPRIEFGEPRRTSPKAYRFGEAAGDAFTAIVIPVRARDNKIVNCRSSVTFTAPWAEYVHEVPGRWENRTTQPLQGFSANWSELDRITLYKDDADDIAIAVQHEGDEDAFALCNRSWEMPLQHGQPDFRHPELLLPRGQVHVEITVRGDELEDVSCTFTIEPVDGVWQPGVWQPVPPSAGQLRGTSEGDVSTQGGPSSERPTWRDELHRVEEAVESVSEVVRDEMPLAPDGRLAQLFTPTRLPTARRRLAGRLAELESAGGPCLPQCRELAEATWYVFYSQVQAGVFSATEEIARTLEARTSYPQQFGRLKDDYGLGRSAYAESTAWGFTPPS